MNIVFSSSYIQVNLFSALLCILVPVLTLWRFKKKNNVKISTFFIGAAFSLLFAYLATNLWNILLLYPTGLSSVFSSRNHPVYSALYGACSIGVITTVGAYVGLKYAMKDRPGKENAFVFAVGMGGFECIFNGTTVYITDLVAALLINSIGSEEYFKKLNLSGEELTSTQQLFSEQAATSATVFLMDATYLILSLVLCVATALLIYAAMTSEKHRFCFPLAFLLHALGYIPVYLTNIASLQNSVPVLTVAVLYTFLVALFAYRVYDSLPKR